jgi:hypothetical protein
MSWSFYAIGRKKAVQQELRMADFHGHVEEKNLVEHYVNEMPEGSSIRVDGHGHTATHAPSNCTITVQCLHFLEDGPINAKPVNPGSQALVVNSQASEGV